MTNVDGLKKNIGISLLPQLINIVANFILPALIISEYGSSINGLVSTIRQIISLVSLTGAGIAISATQSLYGPVAQGDVIVVRSILKTTNKMFNHCGIAYLLGSALVSIVYPLFVDYSEVGYTTITLLVCVMSISGASEFFLVGTCRSLLYADQKVYVCTAIQSIALLASFIMTIMSIKLRLNIIITQLAATMVYVIRAMALLLYVQKHYGEFMRYQNAGYKNSLKKSRNDAMIHQFSGLAVMGCQSIILTIFVGLEAASIFAVYNIVFSGLSSICANLNNAVTPYLGKALALGDKPIARKKFDALEFAMNNFTAFIFSVTAVMIIPFVQIYTRNLDIDYINRQFAVLFLIFAVLNNIRLPGQSAINAAGHFSETKNRAIIEAVTCIFCSVVFTKTIGLCGVMLGSICALGWRCFDIIFYANKHVLSTHSKKSFLRVAISFLHIGIVYFLCSGISERATSIVSWVIVSLITSAVSIIILALEDIILQRDSVHGIIQMLKRRNSAE
ncbi:MAG: hypothetical protein RR413_07210 [Christensenellaceae bacterium]